MQLIDCGTAPGHLINVIIIIKMFTEFFWKQNTKKSETPRFLGTAEPQTVSRKSSPELLADRGVKEKSFMTMIKNIFHLEDDL